MNPEPVYLEDIIDCLKSNRLFTGLEPHELGNVAHSVELVQVARGETVSQQGRANDSLWIVYSGKLYQTARAESVERFQGSLESGAAWGLDCRKGGKLRFSVKALTSAVLMRLPAASLSKLCDRYPVLDTSLAVLAHSRALSHRLRLDWLQDGEEVFFAGRRHPFFLVMKTTLPLSLAAAAAAGALAFPPGALVSFPVGPLVLFTLAATALGACAWQLADWLGDLSLVTSLRAAWLDRVGLIYDSRQETPLANLLAVDTRSTQLGRWIGYGDVVVTTPTGQLVLPDVSQPGEVAELIRRHWELARAAQRREDQSRVEGALKERLSGGAAKIAPGPDAPPFIRPGALQRMLAKLFRVRARYGGDTRFRKHWIVLLAGTWKPTLAALAVVGLGLGFALRAIPVPLPTEGWLGLVSLLLGLLAWGAYGYADWRNDTYQVTRDRIIEIERHPFGREVSRVSQLENIQSVEYRRTGFLSVLLNYGTVSATVGISTFVFDRVYDPSGVQQELFVRISALRAARKLERVNREPERAGDWVAAVPLPGEPGPGLPAQPFMPGLQQEPLPVSAVPPQPAQAQEEPAQEGPVLDEPAQQEPVQEELPELADFG